MKKFIFAALSAVFACVVVIGLTGAASAANAVYPKYKEAAMGGGANVDLLTCNMRAVLVDLADYTYSASHEFLSDVPAGARVAVSGNLTGTSVTDGTFDSDALTWSSVTGDVSEAIILYCHTGSDATGRLFYFTDTDNTGLPVTPNGGDITFSPDVSGWVTL